MTEALLLSGVASAVVFLAVLFIEGARRAGYDAVYHTGSELSLGDRGWIQRVSFFQMGAGSVAFGVGIHRALDTEVGAALLATFGVGMFVAGLFVPDPLRGFPVGAAPETPAEPTWQHQVHDIVGGPVAFLAIFGACLVVAGHLDGFWRLHSLLTAVIGFALTVSTAAAYQKDAAKTGLVQRGLIVVYWGWIVVLGIHLA